MRLLLASKSVTRRAMLEAAGVDFEIVDTDLDEESAKEGLTLAGFDPRETALRLAELKALGVAAGVGDLILGSDQTLEWQGEILSKPASRTEARDQLLALGGNAHALHSAAVIVEGGQPLWSGSETVELTMRPLSEAFIETYLDAEFEAIRHSIGGYRIEGLGAQLFERIHGSHFAILGLPLLPLLGYLRERGLMAS